MQTGRGILQGAIDRIQRLPYGTEREEKLSLLESTSVFDVDEQYDSTRDPFDMPATATWVRHVEQTLDFLALSQTLPGNDNSAAVVFSGGTIAVVEEPSEEQINEFAQRGADTSMLDHFAIPIKRIRSAQAWLPATMLFTILGQNERWWAHMRETLSLRDCLVLERALALLSSVEETDHTTAERFGVVKRFKQTTETSSGILVKDHVYEGVYVMCETPPSRPSSPVAHMTVSTQDASSRTLAPEEARMLDTVFTLDRVRPRAFSLSTPQVMA